MGKRANNEGSIYKEETIRKDGTKHIAFVAAVTIGYDDERRPIRKKFKGKTQSEVRAKMEAAKADLMKSLPVSRNEKQTLGDYMAYWLENEAKTRLKPKSFERYQSLTNNHIIPMLGHLLLNKLARQHVQTFFNKKQDEETRGKKKLAPATINYMRAVLRSALNDAIKSDLIVRNVAALADPPKVEKKEIVPLMPEQLEKLLTAIKADRMEAFYLTGVMMGLRSGELLGLTWDCIDLDKRTLKVEKALQRIDHKYYLVSPKSQSSRRLLDIPLRVVAALQAHLANQLLEKSMVPKWGNEWGLIFTTTVGNPIHAGQALQAFRRVLKNCGLPSFRIHDLRHSCASFLMAYGSDGFEVMKTLGHSTITLTMDTYSHVLPELRRRIADKMDEIIGS